jgi:hypothetical protein
MARSIRIQCPCGAAHIVEPAPYGSATVKAGEAVVTTPTDAEPQTVPCCAAYSYRVIWRYVDRSRAVAHRTRRRGRIALHVGPRATVSAYRDGKMVASWSWNTDEAARGKALMKPTESERKAREGDLAKLLDLDANGRSALIEGPGFDKHTRKPLEQPSRQAHDARELRDEINRIDVAGKVWMRFYGLVR